MIHEIIYLKDHFKNINTAANLTTYCPLNYPYSKGRKRKVMLIIPGGGYSHVAEREAEPIALNLLQNDIACFILRYTIAPFEEPTPLDEVYASLIFIRRNAEKYNIDIDKIGVIGFSAGGHLAASCAAYENDPYYAELLCAEQKELKTNILCLSYPVITMKEASHVGTRLERTHGNLELINKYSIEDHITPAFPKTFIWLTSTDTSVPPENSILLASNLLKNNVTCELHMYPMGPHGLSLANKITREGTMLEEYPVVNTWIKHCLDFINLYL